ncbi:MAG TPA: PLDc N-terminal domain-containing protein [Gaiellaceae bacterium]
MAWFWWLLGILVVVIWIATIVDIIRRRHTRTAGKTAAWILLILIFPILGTIIYFLVNGASDSGAPRDVDVSRGFGGRV